MAKPTPAARLRRTFHYPSDDDDDASSTTEILDEQEQETLITTLTTQNNARNATTHRLLYLLPSLSAIPFLLDLFLPPPTQTHRLLPLLGLSSLAATGLLLIRLGVTETGFWFLDLISDPTSGSGGSGGETSRSSGGYGYGIGAGSSSSSRGAGTGAGAGKRKQRGGILGAGAGGEGKSPLEAYLPWLNAGLAALALLTGLLQRVKLGPQATGVNPLLLGALPGVVFAVIVGAKVAMAGIDPERELSGFKYGYKGA